MDPILKDFLKLSTDFCFLIDKTRVKLLKEINENSSPLMTKSEDGWHNIVNPVIVTAQLQPNTRLV